MKVTLQSTLACIDTCTQQQERAEEEQINAHPLLYLKVTHSPFLPPSHYCHPTRASHEGKHHQLHNTSLLPSSHTAEN